MGKPSDSERERNGVNFDLSLCDIEVHDGGGTERSIDLYSITGEALPLDGPPYPQVYPGKAGKFDWGWMGHVPYDAADRFGVGAHIFEKYEPFSGDEPVYSLHFNGGCDEEVLGEDDLDINRDLLYRGGGGLDHALYWAYCLVYAYKETERGAQVFQFGSLPQPDRRAGGGAAADVYDETFDLLF